METTGVKTFSTTGRSVAKNTIQPIPAGEYTLRIRPEHIKVGCSDKEGAIPYVQYSAEAEGTATSEGGRNRLVFANLFLSQKPGKDGIVNTDRANGLTALAKALGSELEGVEVLERDTPEGKVDYLNPAQIADFLRNNAGVEFKAYVKVEVSTYNGEKTEKNVISRFVARES